MSCRRPPAPRLDPGTKIYYKRIEDLLEGEEEGGQETVYFKNIIDQVVTDGARLVSCDKDGSKALELLLRHHTVNSHSLKKLVTAVKSDFFKLCVNRCGSHVMQTLLKATGDCLCRSNWNTDSSEHEELMSLFMELVGVIQEKLIDCMRHPYASHVLGSLLQVLGGVKLPEKLGRSRYSLEFRSAKMGSAIKIAEPMCIPVLPKQFERALNNLYKCISKLESMSELMMHQNSSPVLQCLVRVLDKCQPKKAERLIKKMVGLSQVLKSDQSPSIPVVFTDLVGSHLMETLLQLAPLDLQTLIFSTCFKGRVMAFALHPVANFPLQQLISSANSDLLENIMVELKDLEEILFVGHTGLVVQLVQAAVSCPHLQLPIFSLLVKAFHTEEHPKSIAHVLLPLVTYEVYTQGLEKTEAEDKDETANGGHAATLHGSLLLQALLKYEDPNTVARSLLGHREECLVCLCCDPCASHILTTFFSSQTVSIKKKGRMRNKLLPSLVSLCLNKHGSRVVDILWKEADLEGKKEIAQILLSHEEKLSADFYGNIILRNCNIASFRSQQEDWMEGQKQAGKKKKVFQDLLEDAGKRRKRKLKDVGTVETENKKIKPS